VILQFKAGSGVFDALNIPQVSDLPYHAEIEVNS
jgi:hypothetical protein